MPIKQPDLYASMESRLGEMSYPANLGDAYKGRQTGWKRKQGPEGRPEKEGRQREGGNGDEGNMPGFAETGTSWDVGRDLEKSR